MARLRVILRAVARAAGRGSKSIRQVSGNNMFYAGVTLLFMSDPAVLGLFMVLIAIVIFLPSSSDPLAAVPADRLGLWPLNKWERLGLRMVSPLLNPLAWLVLAGLLWKRLAWSLSVFVAGLFLAGFAGSAFPAPRIWVPRIPAGRLTHLVRKDLRQFATALDLYCALLIAVPAGCLRLSGELPTGAVVPFTGLVILILSTMALTLFGLDGDAGMTRHGLWALTGWRVLAAKGIAYLLLVLVVTAPLSPGGGLAGGLMALAAGQVVSLKVIPQSRWRFRASGPFGSSVAQMVSAIGGFGLVTQLGLQWIAVCAAVYGLSLWWCGRRMDSRSRSS